MFPARTAASLLGGLLLLLLSTAPVFAQTQQPEAHGISLPANQGLNELLAELRDELGIVPVGTFESLGGGDVVLVPLYDPNHLGRRLYLYYWLTTSETFFLQIEGRPEAPEVHLWNASSEILLTPTGAAQLSTPGAHTFRTRSMMRTRALSPTDALACIARKLGFSTDSLSFSSIKNILSGACVIKANAEQAIALWQTAIACITSISTLGVDLGADAVCTLGIFQLVACNVLDCSPSCTAPAAPSGLSASVSGNHVTFAWNAPSGQVNSYLLDIGSSSGASNLLSGYDLGSTATAVSATGDPGTYYVRVRAKNTCGTSGPSNEVVVKITGAVAGPTLIDHTMTNIRPSTCNVPPRVSTFKTSDAEVNSWFSVSGAKVGDAVEWRWFKPDGSLYFTANLTGAYSGDVCFWDWIFISGYVPSTLPGNWSVKIYYNGQLLISESFKIQ